MLTHVPCVSNLALSKCFLATLQNLAGWLSAQRKCKVGTVIKHFKIWSCV